MNNLPLANQRKSRMRGEQGMSLATVLALCVVTSLWVTAMMGTVLPTYQKAGQLKSGTSCRVAAEATLDYVLSQMNNAVVGGGTSAFDCGPNVGNSKVSVISPSAVMGSQVNGQNMLLQVMVQNVPVSQPTVVNGLTIQPLVYSQQIKDITAPPIGTGTMPNPYRLVTVSATVGAVTKALRVMLTPQSVQWVVGGAPGNVPTSSQAMPYVVYGVNSTAFVGSVGANSYLGSSAGVSGAGTYNDPVNPNQPRLNDPRVRADFGTGTTANQVGYGGGGYTGMALGGSQLEFPNPISTGTTTSNAIMNIYNATAVSQAAWCNIYDNVYSNYTNATGKNVGTVYADQSTGGIPSSGYIPSGWGDLNTKGATVTTATTTNQQGYDNIYGLSNVNGSWPIAPTITAQGQTNIPPAAYSAFSSSATTAPNMGGVLTNAQNYQPPVLAPVPSSPNGSPHLGTINLSGTATIVIQNGAPVPAGGITKSSGTLAIPPGDYSITGLNMQGTSKINIDANVTTPTNFYLEGNISSTPVQVGNTASINMAGLTQNAPVGVSSPLGNTGFNLSNNGGNINGASGSTNQTGAKLGINPTSNVVETGSSASNLTLFYNGPGAGQPGAGSPANPPSTTFSLYGQERMKIYAPAANILIGNGSSSNTKPCEYFGSTVGNWITMTGPQVATATNFTAIHYDVKLKPNGAFLNFSGNVTPPPMGNGGNGNGQWKNTAGYKAVTWQEAKSPSSDPNTWNNPGMWQ